MMRGGSRWDLLPGNKLPGKVLFDKTTITQIKTISK